MSRTHSVIYRCMQPLLQPIPLGVTFSKAQSSKLERLFCHVSVKRDVGALSFELWALKQHSKMSPQVGLAVLGGAYRRVFASRLHKMSTCHELNEMSSCHELNVSCTYMQTVYIYADSTTLRSLTRRFRVHVYTVSCTYLHVDIRIHIYIYTYIYSCIYNLQLSTCHELIVSSTYVQACIQFFGGACWWGPVYTFTRVYTYIHVYIYICIYMYAYIVCSSSHPRVTNSMCHLYIYRHAGFTTWRNSPRSIRGWLKGSSPTVFRVSLPSTFFFWSFLFYLLWGGFD